MAHSCPVCDQVCYCGGDIDDLILDDTDEAWECDHCPDGVPLDYYDDDDRDYCLACGCYYPCECSGELEEGDG